MVSELKTNDKVVGVKQTRKAVESGRASHVFLARNADPWLVEEIELLCQTHHIPVGTVPTMRELGSACGIEIGAAVAAVLNKI